VPECLQCEKEFESSTTAHDVCPECSGTHQGDSTLHTQSTSPSKESPRLRPRFPWLTCLFVALLAVTYLVQVFAGHPSATHPFDSVLLALGMNGEAIFSGQWWRLLTSIFVHGDLFHAVSNACFLLLFGSIAEMFFQRASYIVLCLVAGIAGSMAQLIALSPRSYGYGASGVAFGLVGALWSASFVHRVASGSAVRKWSIPFLLGIFIVLAFLPDWLHSRSFNTAHLAGLLTGMILGLVLPTRTTPAPVRRLVAIIAIAAVVFVGCAKIARAKQVPMLQQDSAAQSNLQRLLKPDAPAGANAKPSIVSPDSH
jgi:rhomboid protease GluP